MPAFSCHTILFVHCRQQLCSRICISSILEWTKSLQLRHMMMRVALLNMRTSTFTCFVPLHISHNSSAASQAKSPRYNAPQVQADLIHTFIIDVAADVTYFEPTKIAVGCPLQFFKMAREFLPFTKWQMNDDKDHQGFPGGGRIVQTTPPIAKLFTQLHLQLGNAIFRNVFNDTTARAISNAIGLSYGTLDLLATYAGEIQSTHWNTLHFMLLMLHALIPSP